MINPQFENGGDFTEDGVAWVKTSEKYGLIDTEGNFILEAKYDAVFNNGFFGIYSDGYILLSDSEFVYLFNTKGEEIFRHALAGK